MGGGPPQGIRSLEDIPSVNWRGVLALIIAPPVSAPGYLVVGSLSIHLWLQYP